ncbi:MAG: hypothetical protein ACI4EE_13510 [Lachnospiraceae bacterium]
MGNTLEYLSMEAEDMKGTFYGWYMKCQSASQTLAVIPAVHQSGKRRTFSCMQSFVPFLYKRKYCILF